MLTSLIISQILSWLVILGLGLALLALARQVGVLHIRVAPAGALATTGGPSVGSSTGAIATRTLDGKPITVGGHAHGLKLRLLLFVSAQCPLCKAVIPINGKDNFVRLYAMDSIVDIRERALSSCIMHNFTLAL